MFLQQAKKKKKKKKKSLFTIRWHMTRGVSEECGSDFSIWQQRRRRAQIGTRLRVNRHWDGTWRKHLKKWYSDWGSFLNPGRLWVIIIFNITHPTIRIFKAFSSKLRVNLWEKRSKIRLPENHFRPPCIYAPSMTLREDPSERFREWRTHPPLPVQVATIST